MIPTPYYQRCPGETPRAYSAFMTFVQLGHTRSLPAVADKLAEGLPTVKNWSSKFDWADRVHAQQSALLHEHAAVEADLQRRQAADWAKRLNEFREQEWDAAQKLLAAAQCFLESFGDEALQKMNLAQVSRALRISSQIGRLALAGAELPEMPGSKLSPIQEEMIADLKRMYPDSSSPASAPSLPKPHSSVPPVAVVQQTAQPPPAAAKQPAAMLPAATPPAVEPSTAGLLTAEPSAATVSSAAAVPVSPHPDASPADSHQSSPTPPAAPPPPPAPDPIQPQTPAQPVAFDLPSPVDRPFQGQRIQSRPRRPCRL